MKATETKEQTEFSKEVLKVKTQVLKTKVMMKEQSSWISPKLQGTAGKKEKNVSSGKMQWVEGWHPKKTSMSHHCGKCECYPFLGKGSFAYVIKLKDLEMRRKVALDYPPGYKFTDKYPRLTEKGQR